MLFSSLMTSGDEVREWAAAPSPVGRWVPVAIALLLAVGLLATGTTRTSASTTSAVFIMNYGSQRFVEPHTYSFSVDGDFVGTSLRWVNWGSRTAKAHGFFHERIYPSFRRAKIRGTLRVNHLVSCRGVKYYGHYQVRLKRRGPFGTRKVGQTLPTPCG